MPDERCPYCGADGTQRWGRIVWSCWTGVGDEEWQRSTSCRVLEAMNLRARVTRLESALRTIADTHGPGTIAGDAAREGMKG